MLLTLFSLGVRVFVHAWLGFVARIPCARAIWGRRRDARDVAREQRKADMVLATLRATKLEVTISNIYLYVHMYIYIYI